MARTSVNVQENSRNIVITEGENSTVKVTQEITDVVNVTAVGPQGPKGNAGPSGPKGDPGQLELYQNAVITGSLYVSGTQGDITASGDIKAINATFNQIRNNALTPGRIVLVGNQGLLTDNSSFTLNLDTNVFSTPGDILIPGDILGSGKVSSSGDFEGDNATFNQIRNIGLTPGSIVLAGTQGLLTSNTNVTFTSNTLSVPNISASNGVTSSFLGDLTGTASFADDATSSSFAQTASYALNAEGSGFPFTGSAEISGSLDVDGPITASGLSLSGDLYTNDNFIYAGEGEIISNGGFTGDLDGTASIANRATSASFAQTASYALNAEGSGFPFTGSAEITGSLNIIGPITSSTIISASGFSGSLEGTSSFADDALSASFATSASFADDATSASYAQTASYALNAEGSGFPFTGSAEISGSLDIVGPITSSGVISSSGGFTGSLEGTASFATTASFALNAGSGVGFPFTGSAEITGSLDVIGPITSSDAISSSGGFTGSLEGTASYATTASYVEGSSSIFINGTPSTNELTAWHNNNTIKGVERLQYDGGTFSILAPTIFNDDNDDASFQFKGSSDGNLLQVNPDFDDKVGIGTATPSEKLTVIGNVSASSYYGDGSNLTGIDTGSGTGFPFSGSAVITGSLLISGSTFPSITTKKGLRITGSTYQSGDVILTGKITSSGIMVQTSTLQGDQSITLHPGNNLIPPRISTSGTQIEFVKSIKLGFENGGSGGGGTPTKIRFFGDNLNITPTLTSPVKPNSLNINAPGDINIKSTSGSVVMTSGISASGAITASAFKGDGSALTGISNPGFPFTGSAIITGSLDVIGPLTASIISSSEITGSLLGTASFADDATSASFATTASYALNADSNTHLGLPIFTYKTTSITDVLPNAGEFLDADSVFDVFTISSESKDGVLLANSNEFFTRLPGSTYTIIETSSGAFISYKAGDIANDKIESGSLGFVYDPDESSTSGSINDGDIVYLRIDKSAPAPTFRNLDDPGFDVLSGKFLASVNDNTYNYIDLKFAEQNGNSLSAFYPTASQLKLDNILLAPAISKSANLKLNSVTASLKVVGDIDMSGEITSSKLIIGSTNGNSRGKISLVYGDAETDPKANQVTDSDTGLAIINTTFKEKGYAALKFEKRSPNSYGKIALTNGLEGTGSGDFVFVTNANTGNSLIFYEQARITHSGSLHLTQGKENAISASGTGSFKHLTLDYDAMPSSDPGVKGVVYRNASNQLFISTGSV